VSAANHLEAYGHFGNPAAKLLHNSVHHTGANQRLADRGLRRPLGPVGQQVVDRHRQVVVRVHRPGSGRHDSVPVGSGVVGERDTGP
jgi:hypothetical protein